VCTLLIGQLQPARPHLLDKRPAPDQRHLLLRQCQLAADETANCAGANNQDIPRHAMLPFSTEVSNLRQLRAIVDL
jgi:hypothetical protein